MVDLDEDERQAVRNAVALYLHRRLSGGSFTVEVLALDVAAVVVGVLAGTPGSRVDKDGVTYIVTVP